jgi:predicted nucleic acid-binding protein
MSYLDTCVIISYCIDGDPNHSKAINIIERLKKINGVDKFYASAFTIVELYSAVSRNIQSYRLPPGIQEITSHKIKLRLTIAYFLQLLSIYIFSDEAKLADLDHLKLFYKFSEAINLAAELKLKASDLLHVAYASQLMKKGLIRFLVTFDHEILNNKEAILKNIGIEVIGAH